MRASLGDSRMGTGSSILLVPFSSISAAPSLILFSPTDSWCHVIEKKGPRSPSFLSFKLHNRKRSRSFVLIAKRNGSNKQAWVICPALDLSLGPGKQGTIIGWVWIMYQPLWPGDWVRNCDWQPHPNHMVRVEEEHFPKDVLNRQKQQMSIHWSQPMPGSGGFSACQSNLFLLLKCPNCLHPAPSYLPKEKDSGHVLSKSF